jgi:hypothetical protein
MLNDHRALQVSEEQVTEEALGGSKSYKSACNLFYISKHIAKQMDSNKYPMFSKENVKKFSLNPHIRSEIMEKNSEFLVETQKYVVSQIVQKIQKKVKDMQLKLEDQENGLDNLVNIKLYSFCQFLRKIDFKGYSKWCLLNQAVREEHPQGIDLFKIIESNEIISKELKMVDVYHKRDITPGGPGATDEIYEGLF